MRSNPIMRSPTLDLGPHRNGCFWRKGPLIFAVLAISLTMEAFSSIPGAITLGLCCYLECLEGLYLPTIRFFFLDLRGMNSASSSSLDDSGIVPTPPFRKTFGSPAPWVPS